MYRSAREALLITHLYLYQVLILSYEAAQQHAALLKAAPPFALLVCDEAHTGSRTACNPMYTQAATL